MSNPNPTQNLMIASNQWMTRPADERFKDIFALIAHLQHQKTLSREKVASLHDYQAVAVNGDIQVQSSKGNALLTYHSFNQLASLASLSGSDMRSAIANFADIKNAADWVAQGLNYGLEGRLLRAKDESSGITDQANMLVQLANGTPLTLRSITSERYSRIWNLDICQKLLLPLHDYGFVNPPAMDGPAGLYASDKDMFAFLAPKDVKRINMPTIGVSSDDSSLGGFDIGGQQFYPFIITGNSEVGGQAAWFMGGLLQKICGNHIIWGAQDVVRFSVKHTGRDDAAWKRLEKGFYEYMRNWVTAGTYSERQALQKALEMHISKDANGTVEFLRGKGWTKKAAEAAVAVVEKGDKSTGVVSQDPTLLFNVVSALTANARDIHQQDLRVDTERRAGKLLELTGVSK